MGALALALAAAVMSTTAGRADGADGRIDTGFGSAGVVTIADNVMYAGPVAALPDGRILMIGGRYGSGMGDNSLRLVRLRADGSFDPTFGTQGQLTRRLGTPGNDARAVTVLADGRFVVAFTSTTPGNGNFAIARFEADGSVDTTFGTGGWAVADFGGDDVVQAMAVQADGRYVVVGSADAGGGVLDLAVARFTTSGQLDTSFGGTGRVTRRIGDIENHAYAVAVRPDATIVVVGSSRSAGVTPSRTAVVRYLATGALDTSFDTDGWAEYARGTGASEARAVLVEPSGRTVLAGTSLDAGSNSQTEVLALQENGAIDTGYGGGTTTRPGAMGWSLNRLRDGRILVLVGTSTSRQSLVRLDADGTLDATFGTAGLATSAFAFPGSTPYLAVQPDGAAIISTTLTDGNTTTSFPGLARFRPAAPGLTSAAPRRVLDTRSGPRPAAGSITRVATGAPAGASAVLVNLTMTDAEAAGYLTADRCSVLVAGPQSKSNGNYAPGQNIANGSVVPVDVDGSFCLYNETPVHVLVDVQGTYLSGAGLGLTVDAPRRVLDTRAGARPAAGSIMRVATGAPAGTAAVLVNVTMTDATAVGYVTADRCSVLVAGPQSKSNGNYAPGQNIANGSVVPVDADGAFCVYNETPVHLLVDVQGTYRASGGSVLDAGAPRRVLDTRAGARPAAGSITRVATGAPAGTAAVLVNVTMTDATAVGYVTADRCSVLVAGPQSKSNGNYAPGQNIANGSVVPVDADGAFCVYNETPVHLLVDVQGTY